MEEHIHNVLKLCRVCGGNVHKYRVLYKCRDHATSLMKALSINVNSDHSEIHPPNFCDRCNSAIRRKLRALDDGRVMNLSVEPILWYEHNNECDTCKRCNEMKMGGRPKKDGKNRGAPVHNSYINICMHIHKIAMPKLYHTDIRLHATQTISLAQSDFMCSICCKVLNSPLRLSCNHLVCRSCLQTRIETSKSTQCPSCDKYHLLTCTDITTIDSVHYKVISSLHTICNQCEAIVQLGDTQKHLSSGCLENIIEPKTLAQEVKKLMQGNQIQIPTGGQVRTVNNNKYYNHRNELSATHIHSCTNTSSEFR